MAEKGVFAATDLIGGGTGALDKISSANGKVIDGTPYALETGDSAIVLVTSGIYFYTYDATSTEAEDAQNYSVIKPDDVGAGAGRWIREYPTGIEGSEITIQISSGIAALKGPGRYKLQAETGVADDLTQLTGLQNGEPVTISPDTGDTITIKHGTYLKLQKGQDFAMNNVRDNMRLMCEGSDICQERSRASVES